MASSLVFRVALLCALVVASVPLVRAGCTTPDVCPAGQCCGGVTVFGKCMGIGCTCFCPATNGNFKCMVDATNYLTARPAEMAKCGAAALRSVNLARGCATGDVGACAGLGKQMMSFGRKLM